MLRRLPLFVFVALAVSLPASALELDRIEVKSGIGQPLLAEIPVLSTDSSELRNLHVQLASSTTFARAGLERPSGLVASLQFRLVRDAHGKPVIRVTSEAPVERDFLTFLVQVEWGSGRTVREYSLSISAPATLGPSLPPQVEAPQVAMSNRIERAPEPIAIPMAVDAPAAAAGADGVPVPAIPLVASANGATPEQNMAGRQLEPSASSRAKSIKAAMQPAARAGQREAWRERVPDDYGPVRAGDTLSGIASAFIDDRHTLDQAMLALLRANPDAFIGGNINLLRRGAILRAPQPAELSRYDAVQAMAVVHEHIRSWREGKPVRSQPAELPQATTAATKARPTASATRVAEARLEISPVPDDAIVPLPAQGGILERNGSDEVRASVAGNGEVPVARDAGAMELRAGASEPDELQQRQQVPLVPRSERVAATPAAGAGVWPWLSAAFAVLMPISWWLGRRVGRAGAAPGVHRGQAGTATDGDGARLDGNEPMPTAGPGSVVPASPAWHPGVRKTASVTTHA